MFVSYGVRSLTDGRHPVPAGSRGRIPAKHSVAAPIAARHAGGDHSVQPVGSCTGVAIIDAEAAFPAGASGQRVTLGAMTQVCRDKCNGPIAVNRLCPRGSNPSRTARGVSDRMIGESCRCPVGLEWRNLQSRAGVPASCLAGASALATGSQCDGRVPLRTGSATCAANGRPGADG